MYWPLGAPRIYAARTARSSTAVEPENSNQQNNQSSQNSALRGLCVSRGGHLLATINSTTLDIWQTSPVVVLASVTRSESSLSSYGINVSVLLRPDSSIAVVQTSKGHLITYNITVDPKTRVYQQQRHDDKSRRQSTNGLAPAAAQSSGMPKVRLSFRMVIRIDAGIEKALALDEDLVVATEKPAAVQCIRWHADSAGSQTSTELISRLPWMTRKSNVTDVVYDRAMNLFVWITGDGRAYAVQRISGATTGPESPSRLFRGYGFHVPNDQSTVAIKATINARFSLLAIGCTNGQVHIYNARDYVGNIPLSHKLVPPTSLTTTGNITSLSYSPDGYCLFTGYERGWAMWSVYGKLGGNSFYSERTISGENNERWLMGVQDSTWIGGGSEIIFTSQNDDRIWCLETARSAVTGCFDPANVFRTLLVTNSSILVYCGNETSDLVSKSSDPSLWHQGRIPPAYLADQHPIRYAVVSSDGRYVAIAGRRGLAHYSINSGRWKTFDDPVAENAFVVRGGMSWHQHILIAAVERGEDHELRLYSRELGLNDSSSVFSEQLSSPVVATSPSGEDSLLVYTYENILFHYVVTTSDAGVQLVQVGQIGLHGIVRAPARVRAMTWFIPDHQLLDGDPSQDVVHASVIFLVDAKLVLLQPTRDNDGALKYDMQIIANNVEYFAFMKDQVSRRNTPEPLSALNMKDENPSPTTSALQDSLWYFDGNQIQCWTDFQDLLTSGSNSSKLDLPTPVPISTDFYPTSIAVMKGLILGIEPDLVQRRDTQFAFFRFFIRTQLFLPPIFRHYLAVLDPSSAMSLSYNYQRLPYFPHALEVLLHTVLDEEVDADPEKSPLLPSVLHFLSSFPDYLDILVQCTRKTEVRSWKTLFQYLPPPIKLFEESLQKDMLKTAGGYLLILHTFEELDPSSEQCIRLLQMAKDAEDWDLCKELARFLMALDESGDSLRSAMQRISLGAQSSSGGSSSEPSASDLPMQKQRTSNKGAITSSRENSSSELSIQTTPADGRNVGPSDYFSLNPS